jgi:hypothetical protein
MSSRGFTHLEPLASHPSGRTLTLGLHHLPGKRALQAKRAPRSVRRDVFGAQLEQEQIGHDRHRHGAFHPVDLFRDLMLAQPDDSFHFFHQQLHPPPAQIHAHNLPRGDGLWQIGHEDLGLFRPIVAPTLAEDHRDVSEMAQPRPFGVDPKGATMLSVDRGNPDLGILPARQMGDEGFERLPIGELPGTGSCHHIPVALRLDQRHIGARGIGGVGGDHQLLAPGRAPKRLQHVPKQGIFGLVGRIVCAADEREIDWDAIRSPLRHEDDDPKAEDVGMVLAEAGLLGHGMLWPSLALERAVADQIENAILGWGKRLQSLVGKPPQQGPAAPIRRTEQPPIVMVRQMARAMPGQRFQIGPFAIDKVQHQQPAEDQVVPVAKAGPEYPQALRHTAGQTGQGHGPGLLGDTRSDGHSRSSISGSAWTVKDFHV